MALAVTLVASAVGSTAGAQQWYQLCTSGAPASCTALQVNLASAGAGSTDITVRAQNLQGTFGGSTGPSVLDQIFLHFSGGGLPVGDGYTNQPVAGPGVSSYAGVGDLAGATPTAWSYMTDMFSIVLFADNPDAGYFTDIRGCDGPSPLEDPGYVTCGPRGTRWVELAFNVAADLSAADLSGLGFATSYGTLGLEQHVCDNVAGTPQTCTMEAFTPGQQVVPEPGSVILLGSGLGLLALGAHRRRRRST